MFRHPAWLILYGKLREFTMVPGLDPNSYYELDGFGISDSILNWAIRFNDEEYVDFLIAQGADVNKSAEYSEPPLIHACRVGHTNIVRKLLEAKADPNIRWFRRQKSLSQLFK